MEGKYKIEMSFENLDFETYTDLMRILKQSFEKAKNPAKVRGGEMSRDFSKDTENIFIKD